MIMSHILFSQKEIKYLMSHRLTRMATASVSSQENRALQLDIIPVNFDFEKFFYRRNEYSEVY